MSLNKKLLASAIAGLLFSANAGAVILGVDDARVYASEMEAPVDLSADLADTASFEIGYNFSSGEVRYGRFECSDTLTMDNVLVTSGAASVTLGAINGEGTNALFFSMTAADPVGGATDAVVISVDGDNTLEDGGDVTCAFSIYDQPSQAQAGGTTGRIHTTGDEPFISRAPSFVFVGTPDEAVADVEATNGAYTGFEFGNAYFGALEFGLAADVPFKADGTLITMNDLFDADTTITIAGDFSAADDLYWQGWSDDIDAGVATFNYSGARIGDLWFQENGDDAIPESSYKATLNVVANAGYEIADVTNVDVGAIVRNGTQLQAPLAQMPAGWLSRVALTNTGSVARPYEISVMGETGVTFTTDATKLVGTVPANGTKVIDLAEVITGFSAGSRGTVNVSVSAPNNQIQGLYQIVNPAAGSISNHVMVRPGTN